MCSCQFHYIQDSQGGKQTKTYFGQLIVSCSRDPKRPSYQDNQGLMAPTYFSASATCQKTQQLQACSSSFQPSNHKLQTSRLLCKLLEAQFNSFLFSQAVGMFSGQTIFLFSIVCNNYTQHKCNSRTVPDKKTMY